MGMKELAVWIVSLSVACALRVSLEPARAPNHNNRICSTWGNSHFKTFDGDVYQFTSTCDYNFASDCHNSLPEFSVHIQRADTEGKLLIESVVITIKDYIIFLTKDTAVVNEEKVSNAFYGPRLLLERSHSYTKLFTKMGLILMWNGEDALMVELDTQFQNQTCGLCGDYNGIQVYNEFISKDESFTPIQFVKRQRIYKPNDNCKDPVEVGTVVDCSMHRGKCEILLSESAWADCLSRVDKEVFIQACMKDICNCPNSASDFCLCGTLSELSRQCSHAGGKPGNWRSDSFCPKKCPFNMIYEESRSPCLDTCFNQDASKLCKEHDMDGCFCPPGMVVDDLSNTGCIPATECKCSLHDTYFKPGEIVKQECEECLCNSGKWMCKNLPCSATCSVEGGTYITTFDGKSYTFHGNCYYILTKIPGDKGFTVLVELIPCGTQQLDACMKTMVLLPDNNSNNALSFEAGGRVFQNNAEIHLPYVTANIKIFKPSSFHIMIQTEAGLQIQLQLVPIMQIYIALDHSNKKKMEGLCGNYNDAQADDFKTFQGIVEGTAAYFANTWKVHSSCPDQKDHLEDPCAISVENEQYAEHWCSALRDEKGLFSKCHTMVDPQEYYKKCKYSTCSCEKSEDCLCASLSSYVRACMAKGITLEGWRKNVCVKYAESCPATKIFSYGIKRCQQTCRSLSMGSQACTMNFKPVDGCSCPEGFYQNDQGSCVPKAKCPCYHKGDWIEPGKTIMIQDESCICANGSLHCQVSARKIEESLCTAPMVYVNCSNAKVGTSGVECRRTCHKNDGICYAVECQSGCVCPSGMIDDGRGNCVKEFQCPCIHNGAYYFNGAHIKVKCNTCVCQSGTWQCTTKKCPGTCTIYGGGHYITYDGLRYEFEGDCEYIATQDNCRDPSKNSTFSVITENVPCGTTGVTCSKSIKVYLGETELKLGDGKVQLQPLEKEKNVTCKVHRIGIYYAVETDIGLTLLWDRRTTVYITLAPDYKGQVCGVCGNFDDNTKNDFTTRNQLIVASPMEFGNSWKVSSSCPNVDVDVDPCSVSAHRKNWAQIQCNIILDDVFKACHCMVDPVPYYEACVHDSCACDAGGDCECLCTAIAAYAAACNHVNMCINWRNEDLCPVCCETQNHTNACEWHYSPCHTGCYKTCENPNGICNSTFPHLEGCFPQCPPDRPIFHEKNNTCVPYEKCGCVINGTYYNPGDKVPSDEPCQECICTSYDNKTCIRNESYCTGFGDPHYITFDGEYYSHQGNCTYLLVEEIRPNYDNFKIYIDNVHCDIRDRVSCPRSIIVSFESQVIELKNMETNGRVKLKVFVNSKEEHLPFKRYGMKVYSSGLNLILEIPEAEIEVTFNGVAFTIKLPYQKFGNNTQGQCVPCTANSLCQIIKNRYFGHFSDYWLVENPNKSHCTPPTLLPTVPPSKPTLKTSEVPCTANSLCQIIKNRSTDVSNMTTEGCFCPDGTTLFSPNSDICVKKCGCLDPIDIPRKFGEKFEYNCQDCICDEDTKTVKCVDHSCPVIPEPNCNDPGFVLSNETSVDDPCCTELICIPVPLDKCQTCVCSQEIDPKEKLHIINCVPVKCDETCEPPGEKWSPEHDKCSVHSCIHIKDTVISTVAKIVCPAFHPKNCQPGTIQTAPDGCCKTCLEKNKSCKLQTITSFITDRGCKSLQPVKTTFCEGACNTYSKYSASAANMQHRCTCCQEVKTHNETISLACSDGTIKPYNYIYVDKCDCRTTSCGPDFSRTRTRRYLPKTAKTFVYNCQDCTCDEDTKTVKCVDHSCPVIPEPNCNNPGFVLSNETSVDNPCCTELICKPKDVCVHNSVEYQGFKYHPSKEECCGKCTQEQCYIQYNGTNQLIKPGETWSPEHDKCSVQSCIHIKDTVISTVANILCPPFHPENCQPGTIQTAPDGCCKTCLEKNKSCKLKTITIFITDRGCKSLLPIDMTFCEGACDTCSK
ncbi:MUC2 protein, partial [Polypterus senegalus]|nr:MUC2 protein [Polypterus senegalus]